MKRIGKRNPVICLSDGLSLSTIGASDAKDLLEGVIEYEKAMQDMQETKPGSVVSLADWKNRFN